jgi:hypothetical protein
MKTYFLTVYCNSTTATWQYIVDTVLHVYCFNLAISTSQVELFWLYLWKMHKNVKCNNSIWKIISVTQNKIFLTVFSFTLLVQPVLSLQNSTVCNEHKKSTLFKFGPRYRI